MAGSKTVSNAELSAKVVRYNDLNNERNINEKYLLDIRNKLEDAQLKDRMGEKERGLVISVAEAPRVPIEPMPYRKVKMFLMSIFLAVVAGLTLAYVWDSFDRAIRSKTELAECLGVPVIATIDRMCSLDDLARKRAERRTLLLVMGVVLIISHILVLKFS